jgi:O-antigen ligase
VLNSFKNREVLSGPKSAEALIPFAQGGLIVSLNLFLFSLPLAYITALREIFFGLGIFFWLLLMILNRRFLWPRTPLDWPLLLWLVCVLISLFWAVNPAYSFKKIHGDVLKGIVVYYLLAYAAQEQDAKKQIFFSLSAGNFLMILYGFWDFWQTGGSLTDYSMVRARSLHQSYPEFGTYLITVLPFFLVSFFAFSGKKVRWIFAVLSIFNLFSVYFTFGRAMWLASGVELLLIFWFLNQKKIILVCLSVILVFALAIPKSVWFHGETLHGQKEWKLEKMGGTGGDLIEVWKLALNFLKDRPFRGIGYGRNSFSEAFPDFRASHQPLLWHAHNTFLNIAFQTGLQGLLAFLWLTGAILYYAFRHSKVGLNTWTGMFNLSVMVMVIGFFIRNFFDDLYVEDTLLLFWFLVGAAFSPISHRDKRWRPIIN